MRITQGMISSNMLNSLNRSYAELDKYFNQLNTGKKFNRPSESPVAAMNALNYRTELSRIEQYQRNTDDLRNWYSHSDSALEQVTSGLQRVRELAVQVSNDTYNDSQRQNIIEEVKQVKQDLISVANMKVNDKYIFNGTNSNTPPIVAENGVIDYASSVFSNGQVNIEISGNSFLPANVKGSQVFGVMPEAASDPSNPSDDLFSVIDRFIASVENNDPDTNLEVNLDELDAVIDRAIDARADLGAKMNRLDLVENRLNQQEVISTQILSENEDVNFAETITNLMTQESIHRAALSSGARILQPTLLDFLR